MDTNLSATLSVNFQVSQRVETGLESADFEMNTSRSVALTAGTGSGQADQLWSAIRTLTKTPIADPVAAPTVDPVGGGSTGGSLAAGAYQVRYSYTTSYGGESLPSPLSSAFAVAAGNVPRVTLPSLPTGVTGITLYITDKSATAGSEHRYAAGITTTTYDLASYGNQPPAVNTATFAPPTSAPTVSPTGGGTTGGLLSPGVYLVSYTYVNSLGETTAGPDATFTLATLGNIPLVTLPSLPTGVTGINVYLSTAGGDRTTETRYNSAPVTATTVTITRGGPVPPTSSLAVLPAPTYAPTVTGTLTATSLAPGNYYAKISYVNGSGETTVGPESVAISVTTTAPTLSLLPPGSTTLLPAGATSINLYLTGTGGASGTESLYKSGLVSTTVALDAAHSGLPGTNTCVFPPPQIAPTVAVTGGTGALLTPGSYYVKYTYLSANGETTASPDSLQFTVAADQIPQVTLPTLPAGATGINLYVTPAGGAPASAVLYNTAPITTTTYNLVADVPTGTVTAPASNTAVITPPSSKPTVDPAGYSTTGGLLAAGNYRCRYTYVNAQGETTPSPESDQFPIAAGNRPRVYLPALPAGVTSINLYMSGANGPSGVEALYTSGILTTTTVPSVAAVQAAPSVSNTAALPNPSAAPTVSATGGGTTGGSLQAGTYIAVYTFVGSYGESAKSAESSAFTISAGNVPRITMDALPTGFTSYNVYLTPAGGASASERLYATGVSASPYDAVAAFIPVPYPTSNTASLDAPVSAPTTSVVAGSGGHLAAGNYYAKYTYINSAGGETTPSPESAQFAVASGQIVRLFANAAPAGFTQVKVYLTAAGGASGTEKYYGTISSGNYLDLSAAAPTGTAAPPGASTAFLVPPASAPSIQQVAGASNLPSGTYRLRYSLVNANGETTTSPETGAFAVASGFYPVAVLGPLPSGASSFSLYLTLAGGGSNTEVLYASGITGSSYNMTLATRPFPPSASTALVPNPSSAPSVNPTGGGASGGSMKAGTYRVKYTFRTAAGETLPSNDSATFTVAAGNIPQVTLPSLPTGATSISLYATSAGGGAGTETYYASGIVATTYNMSAATKGYPVINTATLAAPGSAATVAPSGGSLTGQLAAGTYRVVYTWTSPAGETTVSPESSTFTVSSGNIPRVTFTPAPSGMTASKIYVSPAGGAAGSEVLYGTAATGASYFDLVKAVTSSLPQTSNTATLPDPTAAPSPLSVYPSGGTSSMVAGTYYIVYTWVNSQGESMSSPEASFTHTQVSGVNAAIRIPFPTPPAGVTGMNVYVSAAGGASGSEKLAVANVQLTFGTYVDITSNTGSASPPVASTLRLPAPLSSAVPSISAAGGGTTGGVLPAGTYRAAYSNVTAAGETTISGTTSFTVAAGNIPQWNTIPLPAGATGAHLYLSAPGGDATTLTRYTSTPLTTNTAYKLQTLQTSAAQPAKNSAAITAPAAAAVVDVTGGGSTGGLLAAGTYYLKYSYVNQGPNTLGSGPGETTTSPSVSFTIAAGNIPRVTLPAAPDGVSSLSVYLTPAGGVDGSQSLYASGITSTVYDLSAALLTYSPPASNAASLPAPSVAATVDVTGGGSSGGGLAAGTYYLKYTAVTSSTQQESLPSPETGPFTVAAGNIPRVTLPAAPAAAYGSYKLYLTAAGGASGSEGAYGSAVGASQTASVTTDLRAASSPVTQPASNTCVVAAPGATGSLTPSGGGFVGGTFPAGTYFLTYTFFNSNGETTPSPELGPFTVAAGNTPQLTLPSLPAGATGYRVYLTLPGGVSGSEVSYDTDVLASPYTLTQTWPPAPVSASTAFTASDEIDLNGVLRTIFGDTVTAARVKGIAVFNDAAVDGQDLWLSPCSCNPWSSMFGGGLAKKIRIGAGGFFLNVSPLATGFPVVAGVSDTLLLDGGNVAVPYEILVLTSSS